MPRRTRRTYKTGSKKSQQASKVTPTKEKVVPHVPEKPKPNWAYSLREGGQRYPVDLPNTPEQIEKVEKHVTNPNTWRRYVVNPYGGNRNYTLVMVFPPFNPIQAAEIFFPDKRVWVSSKRKFKQDN